MASDNSIDRWRIRRECLVRPTTQHNRSPEKTQQRRTGQSASNSSTQNVKLLSPKIPLSPYIQCTPYLARISLNNGLPPRLFAHLLSQYTFSDILIRYATGTKNGY